MLCMYQTDLFSTLADCSCVPTPTIAAPYLHGLNQSDDYFDSAFAPLYPSRHCFFPEDSVRCIDSDHGSLRSWIVTVRKSSKLPGNWTNYTISSLH